MKYNKEYIKSLNVITYIVPLMLSTSIEILNDKSFYHISGHNMRGSQAVVFGLIIMFFCVYILYLKLYKIPKNNVSFYVAKKVVIIFISSSFFISLLILLTFTLLKSYIPYNISRIIYIALIMICYVTQKDLYEKIDNSFLV